MALRMARRATSPRMGSSPSPAQRAGGLLHPRPEGEPTVMHKKYNRLGEKNYFASIFWLGLFIAGDKQGAMPDMQMILRIAQIT